MRILPEFIHYFKNTLNLEAKDLEDCTDREKEIWLDYNIELGPHDKTIESRFVKKLWRIGIFSILKHSSGLKRRRCEIYLKVLFVRFLALSSAIKFYTVLAERIVTECIKYGLPEQGYYLCSLLHTVYSIHINDNKKRSANLTRLNLFSLELEMHNHGTFIHSQLCYHLLRGKKDLQKAKDLIHSSLSKISRSTKINNAKYIGCKNMIYLMNCELNRDYRKAVSICEATINKLKLLPVQHRSYEIIFINKKVEFLVSMSEYQKAEEFLLQNQISDTKSLRYFRYQETLLQILLKQLKFEDAIIPLALLKKMKVTDFGTQAEERLKIYNLYISLFIGNKISQEYKNFSLEADLKDHNISITIANLVSAASRKDFQYLENQKSNLTVYLSRHCKDNPRSKLFIRLLMKLPLAQTDPNKWRIDSNRLYGKMKIFSDTSQHVEIINYEYLWPVICEKALSGVKYYDPVKIKTIRKTHL